MRKLLIANRGEIARRIIRTARDMGVGTVAVYSDPDRRAPHVEEADEGAPLGGATPAASYLRIDKLLAAAERCGADAVHPGYGFLAENEAFARACEDGGLTFVGPSPHVIGAMGDKLQAKALMREVGVPVLDTYEPDDVPADAFPVIVKAAAGGGGKGMRVVAREADLDEAVAAARREAAGAFGDDRVFVERYLSRPRHVEVQIFGDASGTVLHVGERECSVQRRHQKVIEESPSPAIDDALRGRITDAAIAAGAALGYTNAGTVEFVLDAGGEFFFLEVNTRLQVEHPVTELAWALRDGTGLDLVRLQLLVARGEPLPFTQDDVVLVRHAVEARVYAEDPANGFLPATGTVEVWDPPALPGVRVDSGVREGDPVSVFYDPLLAKVIAAAPTRGEAALLLGRALATTRVHGLTTNRDMLVQVLRHPRFLAGDISTAFLSEAPDVCTARDRDPFADVAHPVAAALAVAHARGAARQVQQTVPLAWRNNRWQPERVSFDGSLRVDVDYVPLRDGTWQVDVGGWEDVEVLGWPDGPDSEIDLELRARRVRVRVRRGDDEVFLDSVYGHDTLTVCPRFPVAVPDELPGSLLAPMPGTVADIAVREGQRVVKGQLLLVLEAMKMERPVTAPHDGVVTRVHVGAGQQVQSAALLAVVATDP